MTGKNSPKHDEIFEDLEAKKRENPAFYAQLHEAMTEVYSCREPEEVLQNLCNLSFKSGYSVDLILKTLKWFFIEQDIRDWSYSGREMFKSRLDQIARLT